MRRPLRDLTITTALAKMAEMAAQTQDSIAAEIDPIASDKAPTSSTETVHHAFPSLSAADDGSTKRPRDLRLIHLVLANLGVSSYQERVPLQLIDFAYRYVAGILQDSLQYQEAYGNVSGSAKANTAGTHDANGVSIGALRAAVEARTYYQFSPTLPKEFYLELASERNTVALPTIGKEYGVRLPPEQYCLTGIGWNMKDEWDQVDVERAPEGGEMTIEHELEGAGEGEDDEEMETMEDVFGHSTNPADTDPMDQG